MHPCSPALSGMVLRAAATASLTLAGRLQRWPAWITRFLPFRQGATPSKLTTRVQATRMSPWRDVTPRDRPACRPTMSLPVLMAPCDERQWPRWIDDTRRTGGSRNRI